MYYLRCWSCTKSGVKKYFLEIVLARLLKALFRLKSVTMHCWRSYLSCMSENENYSERWELSCLCSSLKLEERASAELQPSVYIIADWWLTFSITAQYYTLVNAVMSGATVILPILLLLLLLSLHVNTAHDCDGDHQDQVCPLRRAQTVQTSDNNKIF